MLQILIDHLKEEALSIPLPATMSIRAVEVTQKADWITFEVHCFSPGCESDGQNHISIFSPVFEAVHDHLLSPEVIRLLDMCGWCCRDSEVLPDYGQLVACKHYGTTFWFHFTPRRHR